MHLGMTGCTVKVEMLPISTAEQDDYSRSIGSNKEYPIAAHLQGEAKTSCHATGSVGGGAADGVRGLNRFRCGSGAVKVNRGRKFYLQNLYYTAIMLYNIGCQNHRCKQCIIPLSKKLSLLQFEMEVRAHPQAFLSHLCTFVACTSVAKVDLIAELITL